MVRAIAATDRSPETTRLLERIDLSLKEALAAGASGAEAICSSGNGLSVNVRMAEVESIEHQQDMQLNLKVYDGNRAGSVSTSNLSIEGTKEAVRAACRIARCTEEDECEGLADPDLMPRENPDLELDHPWRVSPEEAINLACEAESAALAKDKRICKTDIASIHSYRGALAYGNTHGFLDCWRGTRHSIECAVIAEDKAGMQREGWYDAARDRGHLLSPRAIGEKAAERVLGRLSPRSLSNRRAPVIFEAPVATSLFGALVRALSGENLYRRTSFLAAALGKEIFPPAVRIREEPLIKQALGSAPFDDEGVATQPRAIVQDGVLKSYFLGSYSARKLGLRSTGNAGGVHNLIVSAANAPRDLPALLKTMHTGLLVTDLLGSGTNLVTGDYSQGVSGFWVERGATAFPVEEVTIAGNLRDIFRGIRLISGDTDRRGNIQTGSVLIEGFTIAGK